jgi:hypothetical protein
MTDSFNDMLACHDFEQPAILLGAAIDSGGLVIREPKGLFRGHEDRSRSRFGASHMCSANARL